MNHVQWVQRMGTLVVCGALLLGCASKVPLNSSEEQPFDQAVSAATDSLLAQTGKLPAFAARLARASVVVDPMLERGTGQQTALTRLLEERVTERFQANGYEVLPFQPASLDKSQYLLTGTVGRVQDVRMGRTGTPFQLDLALVDIKTATVVARASSRAQDDQLDTTPTPYYRDSPVVVKDKVVEGYLRTATTPPGQPVDRDYFQRVTVATTINAATLAYNADRYEEALGLYKTALDMPSGEQLRTLNGIYLANWKLGNTTEAEQAFGRVVSLAITQNNLGVKFLFDPNSTEFWPDAKVSGPYPLWLRQIARHAAASKVCMNIIGHASRTGTERYNDRLSEQRAAFVRQKLIGEAPELAPRTIVSGLGFRENIIGSGTDDAADVLDRRVEFKIEPCGA